MNGRVEINTAAGSVAIVLQLKAEGRIADPSCVRPRMKQEVPGVVICTRNELPNTDCDTVVQERPCAGKADDLDGQQIVCGRVVNVAESEGGRAERIRRVLQAGSNHMSPDVSTARLPFRPRTFIQ